MRTLAVRSRCAFAACLAALLALVGSAPANPAWAAKHYIAGRIIDRNGDPVDQAVITLKPKVEDEKAEVQLVTDREGRFLVDYLRNDVGERSKLTRKVDYKLEVFKPGFHTREVVFAYKKGELQVDTLMLTEDTIAVHDDEAKLDPAAYETATQASGATYEGQ
jgi:hypothetical protein